jgi:hypothetical protein
MQWTVVLSVHRFHADWMDEREQPVVEVGAWLPSVAYLATTQ